MDMDEELLSIREKRLWLAEIFRNNSGEYSQADQFKALVEDTKLAAIQEEEEHHEEKHRTDRDSLLHLLSTLPPPNPVYQQEEKQKAGQTSPASHPD